MGIELYGIKYNIGIYIYCVDPRQYNTLTTFYGNRVCLKEKNMHRLSLVIYTENLFLCTYAFNISYRNTCRYYLILYFFQQTD